MKLSIKIILSAIALLLLITMINYKQKDPYFFLQPQLPFTQEDKAFDLSKEGSESEFEFWILPNKKEDVLPLWHMVGVSCVYSDGKNLIRTESVRLEVGVAFYQNGKWIDVSVFGKKKPPSDEIELINYQVPIDNKLVFMSGSSGGNQVFKGQEKYIEIHQAFVFKPVGYGLYKANMKVISPKSEFSTVPTYPHVELARRGK